MAKKDFSGIADTAKDFFSEDTIAKAEGKKPAKGKKKPAKADGKKTKSKAPQKAKGKEKRTKRVQLLLPPTLFDTLQAKAEEDDRSINETIIRAVRAYTE